MKIEVSLFNSEIEEHIVEASSFYVGRSSQCEVVINHESMSRKHCYVEFDDGKIYVTDLGSTNGISIDGNRVASNERTYYINSLPLMIGAANVRVDVSDHQVSVIHSPKPNPQDYSKTNTGSHKTVINKKNVQSDSTKSKIRTSKKVLNPKSTKPKKKELMMAAISITAFVAMVAWYFSQK